MKKALTLLFLIIPFCTFSQVGMKGYYFFEYPSKDIFQHPYHLSGKSNTVDPFTTMGSERRGFTEDDIDTSESLKSKEFKFTTLTQSKILNTYQVSDSVSITGSFYKVKVVKLKPNGYKNMDIGSYYVTEALRADSVVIKIKSLRSKGFGTSDVQKIVLSLVKGNTVVSVLGKVLGLDSGGELFRHSKATNDSVVFTVNNPDVYFAARFTKLGDTETKGSIGNWLSGRLPAPACEKGTTQPTKVSLSGSKNPIVKQIISCGAVNARLELTYDKNSKEGQVRLIRTNPRGGLAQVVSSELYDFESFSNDIISSTLTIFNKINKNGSSNYINADYEIKVDTEKNTMIFNNRVGPGLGIAKTCIYLTDGSIDYWPKL